MKHNNQWVYHTTQQPLQENNSSLLRIVDHTGEKMANKLMDIENINRLSKIIKDAEAELEEAGITFVKEMSVNERALRVLKEKGMFNPLK